MVLPWYSKPDASTLSQADLHQLVLAPTCYPVAAPYAQYGQTPAVDRTAVGSGLPVVGVESQAATATYTTPLGRLLFVG